jgi:ribosome-binding ATPase
MGDGEGVKMRRRSNSIRPETIAYDDYVYGKGEAGSKLAGKFRLEGKEYVVADGDVMHFRFNT